jgi:predicted O-methyltransferase YrrM
MKIEEITDALMKTTKPKTQKNKKQQKTKNKNSKKNNKNQQKMIIIYIYIMNPDDPILIKYKKEFEVIKDYIDNPIIYKIFYDYGFTIKNKFIELNSNINVYEACFISRLIDIYLKYKPHNKINVLEIGLAYGTSSLIILNKLIMYDEQTPQKKIKYDIIDPYQTTTWNSIGIYNIRDFLSKMKSSIKPTLYEETSNTIMQELHKRKFDYDIIFIDGSHDEKDCLNDLINSDKMLKKNGLIIIDDVLHKGVKIALRHFLSNYHNYRRISISNELNNNAFKIEKQLYNKHTEKISFNNPATMFCFQKIQHNILKKQKNYRKEIQ